MDLPAEQHLARQLDAGERLLWSGHPATESRLRGTDALVIRLGLLWGGFAVFWQIMVVHSGPLLFAIWGGPFVLVGLYLLVGRFYWEARRRAATFYGVTNRRVILVTQFPFTRTRTLNLRALRHITLAERRDGTGDVVLGGSLFGRIAPAGWPGAHRFGPPVLEQLPRAREVYDLIRRAQES